METSDLDGLLQQLVDEQRLLDNLRRDYVTLQRSRFYGLRAIWSGVKQVGLKRATLDDSFVDPDAGANLASNALLSSADLRLIEGWAWRNGQHPLSQTPIVSIVIPVYNKIDVTVRCLQSLVDTWFESLSVQIILVDDASTDRTSLVARSLKGLDYVRNASNVGFILGCNRGAGVARGKYICFLNNDTTVTDGWLDDLVLTAEYDDRVGAVGSKLVFPDGSLQEAGGLFWSNGNAWNYGRGGDPNDPKFSYVREVDYCSGASLLVRTDLFREMSGFNEMYVPAYFEDSDMCFTLRSMGYRVLYQPKSVVVHYEGLSSGRSTESGVKKFQALNKPKFLARWHDALTSHLRHEPSQSMRAARRLGRGKTLVMIDNYVPEFDKDSGSNKLFNIIKEFQNIGFEVIYIPDNYHRSEPYTNIFQSMGVEIVYGTSNGPPIAQAVRERLALADLVWVGRPEIAAKWLPVIRENPKLPVVYDTHDLHYVRVERELILKDIQDEQRWSQWRRERDVELGVIHAVDVAITVTDVEKGTLESEGVAHVAVIPNVHDLFERKHEYAETDGLIFIGGYQHGPNVDGAIWFCEEIMPLVWSKNPNIKVTLLGSNPPESVKALAGSRVAVPGFIHDVSSYFERARVFVAPLRFGAGLKGKIGQAFAYRLPTVTTAIGAEGFGIESGRDAIVADEPGEFAEAILRVYNDRKLWERLSEGAATRVTQFSPEQVRTRLEALVALASECRSVALNVAAL